jgi:hypothetical protein
METTSRATAVGQRLKNKTAIVLVGLTTLTQPAWACHKFSIWRYPRPQLCHATALAPRSALRLPHARIDVSLIPPSPRRVETPALEFSLPSLSDIVWGSPPDDELRGKLLLRVLLQGKGQ